MKTSQDLIIKFGPMLFIRYFACNNIRVSASSWSDYSLEVTSQKVLKNLLITLY